MRSAIVHSRLAINAIVGEHPSNHLHGWVAMAFGVDLYYCRPPSIGTELMRKHRRSMRAACALVLVVTGVAECQASCRLPGGMLGPAVQESLKREPRTLLLQYPQGEDGLRGASLQMAAAGPDMLDAVASLIILANNPQRKAIGAGFASAVNSCSSQDPSLAAKITQAAKNSGSAAVQRSFNMELDTSSLSGNAAPRDAAAAAVPSSGLVPTIGSMLPIPQTESPRLSDPFGDPAGWH